MDLFGSALREGMEAEASLAACIVDGFVRQEEIGCCFLCYFN